MLDVNALVRQLVLSDYKPAVIVGIARGGLTPGVMISHWLNLPFKPIHASLRDFPHWEAYLPKPTDKRVLVVDDICDSGETFSIDGLPEVPLWRPSPIQDKSSIPCSAR